MSARTLALFALLAAAARADLQLLTVDSAGERPVGTTLNLGQAGVGDTLPARFRLRNTGAAAVTVRTLSVAGTAFSMADAPALPRTLPPGQSFDFTIAFQPQAAGSFSAVLQSEGVSAMLSATAVPALSVIVGGQRLGAGAAIDFGSAERGQSATRTVTLENPNGAAMLVPEIAVIGTGFRLAGVTPAGQRLDPTASISFGIVFQPAATGAQEGTLAVGGRTFPLRGTAVEPPLPGLTLQFDPPVLMSGQQGRVGIAFDAPARTSATGTLTLRLQPSATGATDPAVVFASGASEAAFNVVEGATAATFSGQPSVAFQAGTTAGSLVFTTRLGDSTRQATLGISPVTIGITATSAARTAAGIDVKVTAFDNTRTAGPLTFTFYDAAGNAIAPGAIRTDIAAQFARYFGTSEMGGVFLLQAAFPVTGAKERVDSVEVQLGNMAGAIKTARVKLP